MDRYLNTVTYDGKALLAMVACADFDSALLRNFQDRAEALLDCERISVMDRKMRAASGNPHDYASQGPYWWPNPDTPDGLPYICKDGVTNPASVEPIGYDKMTEAVHHLALAALYFQDGRYAERAVKLLRVWHLDPETYMTPHMECAQAIPGVCEGRGIGIIDLCTSYRLFNAVAILEYLGMIDPGTLAGLKQWYVDYTDWLLTSEKGADEDNMYNNHGTWLDVQVAAAATFTDRHALAQKTLNAAYIRRVAKHIEPGGVQPYERARTRGISYSLFNLDALTLLGNMARRYGIVQPYWKEDGDKGDLMRSAIDYIYPYAVDPASFPYTELCPDGTKKKMAHLLARAQHYYPGQGYAEKAAEIADDHAFWRLEPQA